MGELTKENVQIAADRFLETFLFCQEEYGAAATRLAFHATLGASFVAAAANGHSAADIIDMFEDFADTARDAIIDELQEIEVEQNASTPIQPTLTVVK